MKYGTAARSLWIAVVATLLAIGSVQANDELVTLQNDPNQFVMPNANYAATNFSPLDRINTTNVQNLEVKWTFQTGVLDSTEAQPLVIGNTMYIMTPKPNAVIALDLEREGVIKWAFQPEMDTERAGALACCGAQSRGLAYADGDLFFATLDGQLFSISARDGSVNWQVQAADLDIGETTPGNPLLINDHIIIGNEGGERGVRGWIASFDMETGEQRWKFYSTGPDDEMGITDRFQPFYADDQVASPGTATWYEDSWQRGGGTAWGWWSYDPELDMFYYGTSNCAPWNADYRRDPATAPGIDTYQNKYCASLIARDGTSGEMIWAHSHTPQDQWDFDEPGQNILADIEWDGEERAVILKPARNGFFYIFDRATGEIINDPFTYTTVNWADGIDLETGRPMIRDEAWIYTGSGFDVCPFIAGNNIMNDSYSPETGLVYFSAENRCNTLTGIQGEYAPGENYILMDFGQSHPGPGGFLGELQAWDPITGEKAWGIKTESATNEQAVFTTGGNLLFVGSTLGEFRALDARTGEELWSFRTGSDFRGSPMTYIGPDGRQYIAVIASRGPSTAEVGPDTAADNANRYRRPGSTLYVFGLR
jgi:PQQ-dependent dehydrogenase (methanol/ethanol family)